MESAAAKSGIDPGCADNLILPRETGEEAPHEVVVVFPLCFFRTFF
jgi:hypothetical protein